jgi:two-component sensor histidine kinase
VEACLPLIADLVRGDVFLFRLHEGPLTAIVAASAKPQTVAPVAVGLSTGSVVSHTDEPGILRALTRGAVSRQNHRLRTPGHPTVQDVYPIRGGHSIVAAMAVETGLVEAERMQRKSIVYRRAVERLRRVALAGRLEGVEAISRLSEHDGPMVVTAAGEIVYISTLAEQLYRKAGYTHSLEHYNLSSLRTDESVFYKAIETNACVEEVVQEGPFTWLRRAIPLTGDDEGRIWNRVVGRPESQDQVILTVHDVTDETQKERELKIKSAMIQEIHHRVKNNLQTIAALLRLQARRTGSPEISSMLQETINRILSIAIVHEFLAHQESADVDMREIAHQIVSEVTRSILDPEKHVHVVLEANRVTLPTQQATSCALVINELLHNAVEHGFATINEGTVSLRLSVEGNRVVVVVTDDGEGLPPSFDLRTDQSLGLQIVQTLVREDLKGTFQLANHGPHGAQGIVSFPRTGLG